MRGEGCERDVLAGLAWVENYSSRSRDVFGDHGRGRSRIEMFGLCVRGAELAFGYAWLVVDPIKFAKKGNSANVVLAFAIASVLPRW